jgi:hypothetical protein
MSKNQTAGIVCYTVKHGRMYFLLGREQFVPGWNGSHQWSEPGGHAKKIDQNNTAYTAIREFNEESLGVLPDIAAMIEQHQHTAEFSIHRQNRRKRGKTFYLVDVPDASPAVRTEFHIRREQLRGIQSTVHRLQSIQKQLVTAGAPAPETPRRIQDRFQMIKDVLGFQEYNDRTCRVQVQSICPVEQVYFRVPRPNDKCLLGTEYVEIDSAHSPLYLRLLSLKQLLIKQINALPDYLQNHAISYPVGSQWLPQVRREFLEKDRLEWVDVSDLIDRLGDGWCRANFEVPVQVMIRYLANHADCGGAVSSPTSPAQSAPTTSAKVL